MHSTPPVALILFLMFGVPAAAAAARPSPGEELVGLWASETVSGPRVAGELTLTRGDRSWTARAGGLAAEAPLAGDSIRFALPGGEGELRAALADGGRTIRGFWIQPTGHLTFVPYASHVTLVRRDARTWRGALAPVSDRWSLYLLVERKPDGTLEGAFRNPDINWRGGESRFRLERDRDTLRFRSLETGAERLSMPFDSVGRRIVMDFGHPVVLTREAGRRATGFLPRPRGDRADRYRVPRPGTDGWRTAHARSVGLDDSLLQALVRRLAAVDPVAPGAPLVHSVLVARHGRLVLEEYFHGFDAARRHDLRSASKTLTSVLLGAAIADGAPLDPDAPAASFFPWGDSLLAREPEKAAITLAHLLAHSSGLACDDDDEHSPGNEERMQTQTGEPDWCRYTLGLPLVREPGAAYAYCSGGLHVVAGAVSSATRTWLPALFDRLVARPLGIEDYAINLTPAGDAYGGGGMQLRPRDLLKLGAAFLAGGRWGDARLVSEEWVARSTAHRIATASGGSDGLAWHRHALRAADREFQEYEASGNGGQFLIVVPELDLAVVFTAGNYGQYGIWRKFRDELVPQYVLAAIRRH